MKMERKRQGNLLKKTLTMNSEGHVDKRNFHLTPKLKEEQEFVGKAKNNPKKFFSF